MKQKDVALILVIGFISALVAYFTSSNLIVAPENRQQKVEVIDPISATFDPPSDEYFNEQSINPTQSSEAGKTSNDTPFNTGNPGQ